MINGNTLTATVVGLNAWVDYEFRVLASNSVGMGEPSPPSTKIRTEDASEYASVRLIPDRHWNWKHWSRPYILNSPVICHIHHFYSTCNTQTYSKNASFYSQISEGWFKGRRYNFCERDSLESFCDENLNTLLMLKHTMKNTNQSSAGSMLISSLGFCPQCLTRLPLMSEAEEVPNRN